VNFFRKLLSDMFKYLSLLIKASFKFLVFLIFLSSHLNNLVIELSKPLKVIIFPSKQIVIYFIINTNIQGSKLKKNQDDELYEPNYQYECSRFTFFLVCSRLMVNE
jgi:hypothetical protein